MRMLLAILPNLLTDLNNKKKTYGFIHAIKRFNLDGNFGALKYGRSITIGVL